ncbi:PD-(D/E)XK nuclease family protein [Halovenus rubra]|uniref:PD-(D/E)XK nuclease family protein n=2 Tax=Halovenus rubra TaxID=869890 RepID=A0ABD5X362_9EURY|nr:PD-(D/E)XK nuclease family protein [Halovenus rubra]
MTERKLFIGSNQLSLEDEAFEWVQSTSEDGIGRILYLSETANRHDRVQKKWRDSYGHLTLRTETLTSFVYDCYEQIAGPSTQIPEELDRRTLECSLDTIIENRPWLSTQPHASANLVDAFDRRFARFQNVGLNTPDRVRDEFQKSDLPSRIRDTTVEAYETYYQRREAVSEPWYVTYSHAFEIVGDANIAALQPHIDAVVLSGHLQLGHVEQSVIESLVEAFPTAAILPTFSESLSDGVDQATETVRDLYGDLEFDIERVTEKYGSPALQRVAQSLYRNQPPEERTVPETLHWRELPTPEREIRYIARDIRTRIADDAVPSDIGVVVPGFQAYEDYLVDVFDTYDLPYSVETEQAVIETFVGSAVQNLLDLSEDNPRAAALTELVTNPVVTFCAPDKEDAVVAAERRTDSVRVGAVQDQLSSALADKVQTLLEQLRALRKDSFESAIETVRTQLDDHHIAEAVEAADSRIDGAQEYAALEHVHAVLDSFEEISPPTDLTPSAALLRALQGVSLSGYTGQSEQITVLDHLDAREFAFDQLYIVGLTADHFPSTRRHPAFFEEMVDAHLILEVLDERVRDRYTFACLLSNADTATITTPSTDPSSTAMVRSPVLDELTRVTGIEPTTGVDSRIGSREDLQRAISPLTERRSALDAAGERDDFTTEQTIRADRGITCATERASPDISPHDGLLDSTTVADIYPDSAREPYSASRIERYVNCGFQFYMEHVLDLEDDNDIERTPDPLETGTFVHDTFERFYKALQSEPGEGIDIQEYELSSLESHMLEIALNELEDAEFDYSGLFHQRWLEQLFAGLGDPEANPHYGEPRPHQGVDQGLFTRFVEREYNRGGDTLPAWFEPPFGTGLPEEDLDPFEIDLPNGETVEFRGYIDRVDVGVTDEGTQIQLFDYKTGYAPSLTKTTGGTTFQLPIYLLAAEDVLADEMDTVTDLAATYYQTKPPNKLHEPRGIESKFDSDSDLRRFLNEVIPDRLGTISTAVEHGRFHTTVLSQREAGCEYCDFQRSCDVRPHQRRDRVETLDSDPRTYVPIRATDRDFDDEFGGEADD